MRRGSLVVLVSCCLALQAVAAPPDKSKVEFPRGIGGKVLFQEVVIVEGVSGSDLYERARAWAVERYNAVNARNVVLKEHKELGGLIVGGLIIERPRSAWHVADPDWIRHTLILEVADGSYRYTLTDIRRVIVAYVPGPGIRDVPDIRVVEEQPVEDLLNSAGRPKLFVRSSLRYLYEDVLALIEELKTTMAKPRQK